ncbi:hypothetical protein NHX12_011620 [Muraenolepis orangiensis]|uniref:Uncharacterized protein n=1 Tax=Muraenolepis orangiensis TaxID=630683 RepID=A0A9Q0I8Z1_9TELE|nr:hypothetical protein NHX12_011620 [Muraenolepis orangiensis]
MADEGEESNNGEGGQFPESPSSPARSPGAPGGSTPSSPGPLDLFSSTSSPGPLDLFSSPGPLDLFSSTSPLLCETEEPPYLLTATRETGARRSPARGESAHSSPPPKWHRRSRDTEPFPPRGARQHGAMEEEEDGDVDPVPVWRRGDPDANAGRLHHRGQRGSVTHDPADDGNHHSVHPVDAEETRQHQET